MRIDVTEVENGVIVTQYRNPESLGASWVFEQHIQSPEEKRAMKEAAHAWAQTLLKEVLL